MAWRQGGRVPFTVYRQKGAEPDRRPYPSGDTPLTMFRQPQDAALAVLAVNAVESLANGWRGLSGDDRDVVQAVSAQLAEVLEMLAQTVPVRL